jgi:sigma-E factor negative regulatory protein RseA
MQSHERLSALMDDAGDADDREFLAQIAHDRELHRTWSRYHVIRDSLRDDDAPVLNNRFADAMAAAVAREPTYSSVVALPRRAATPPWGRRAVTGLAAAASLAAVAVGMLMTQRGTEAPASATTPLPIMAISPTSTSVADIPVLSEGEYQRRLNAYLVNFNAQRAQLDSPGVPPYVRVVDFETGAAP